MNPYEDIISHPRPVSPRHVPMPRADRAAQFAPFAALTGFGDVITETARLTESRRELDEHEKAALNEMLSALRQRLDARPAVSVTYFRPDERKEGGAYVSFTGELKRIDEFRRCLLFTDGTRVPIDELSAVEEIL